MLTSILMWEVGVIWRGPPFRQSATPIPRSTSRTCYSEPWSHWGPDLTISTKVKTISTKSDLCQQARDLTFFSGSFGLAFSWLEKPQQSSSFSFLLPILLSQQCPQLELSLQEEQFWHFYLLKKLVQWEQSHSEERHFDQAFLWYRNYTYVQMFNAKSFLYFLSLGLKARQDLQKL